MFDRTKLALATAVLATLGGSVGVARAADGVPPGDTAGSARDTEPFALQPPMANRAATPGVGRPERAPLMGLLDQIGVAKPLDDARVRVYGHAEASYTWNAQNPFNDFNAGRVFDIQHDELLLNQLAINFERPVDLTKNQFDLGGRVEVMYGNDAAFIHASGLNPYGEEETPEPGDDNPFPRPDNQFDLTQAYLDVAVPVGNGLRLRLGKFTYFKQIDPNNSVFYSHSYTFGAALPFTLTGGYGTYVINDQWTFDAGVSRGWDQALRDNNDAADVFGRVKYRISDETAIALAFITGPEQDDDNGNYRTVLNLSGSHAVNPDLTLLVDGLYGHQAQPDVGIGGADGGGESRWYGVSGYAIQRLSDVVSVAGRLEYYRDDGGYTTGLDQTLWEGTLGLTITPFPTDRYGQYFKIRPEIRYDVSDNDYFDGLTSHTQFTAAIDAIFNF